MRWSFSATFSGVPAPSILARTAFNKSVANSCTSACVNLSRHEYMRAKRQMTTHSSCVPFLINKIRSMVMAA